MPPEQPGSEGAARAEPLTGQVNAVDSNIQKLSFYHAACRYLRPIGEKTVILEPYGGTGKGSLTAVEGYKHYVCEMDFERATEFSERWPDAEIHCGDNREWMDQGFYADMDVVAVDFDATSDPFEAFFIFLRHAKLEKYCLAFFTWGFRNSQRLAKHKKNSGPGGLTRSGIYKVMRQVVIDAADPHDISVKSMGMAVPTIGKNTTLLYGVFSLVQKGGTHAEGWVASEEQEINPSKGGSTAKSVETLELDKLDPAARADVLARLQFTKAEIETMETGDHYERSVLTGEAQTRFALFNTAMGGNPGALKLMAEVIRNRKYQERLIEGKAKMQRTNGGNGR